MTKKKVIRLQSDDELLDGFLDEAVHEEKAEEASRINNEGVDAQIQYLFGEESPTEELLEKFLADFPDASPAELAALRRAVRELLEWPT